LSFVATSSTVTIVASAVESSSSALAVVASCFAAASAAAISAGAASRACVEAIQSPRKSAVGESITATCRSAGADATSTTI
jgi:hypothetical protein